MADTKEFVCPMLGTDGTEVECKLVDIYYCPVAAIPWMDLAILRDLPDCPYSYQTQAELDEIERKVELCGVDLKRGEDA